MVALFGLANYFRGKGDSHVKSSGMFGEKISPWRFQEETLLVLAVKVSFRVIFEEMLSSSFWGGILWGSNTALATPRLFSFRFKFSYDEGYHELANRLRI